MIHENVLASLRSQTDGLVPGPGVTLSELTEARRAVVECLRTGQTDADIGPPLTRVSAGRSDAPDLAYLASARPAVSSPGQYRIARRQSALRLVLDGSEIPPWTVGMSPERSFGPFLDSSGRSHWFDLFRTVEHVRVIRDGQVLLLLPIGTHRSPLVPSLIIPPGTVWILASQLTSQASPGAWVGLRVKRGALA